MNEMITSSNLPSKPRYTAPISPKPSSSVDRLNSFAYGSKKQETLNQLPENLEVNLAPK